MNILATPPTLEKSAATSRRIPLTTKKNGTKTPNAIAVSLESKLGSSADLSTWRVIRPAANPPSSRSSPSSKASRASAKTSTRIQRTASCELLSSVRSSIGNIRVGRAHGEHRDDDGEGHEGEQDQRVVQGALGGEQRA